MTKAAKYRVCTRCGKRRQARFFSGPRARVCSTCLKAGRSKASHEARVQDTYGLLEGEWDKLFEAQNGKCWICQESRRTRLAVDHSHKDGLVRGLLCNRCNNQLLARGARDRVEVLQRAAAYLLNPPAQQILGPRLHRDFREDN